MQRCARRDIPSSFTSNCSAGRLITLNAILSTAACLPMLQHKLSADCSGKTTAFMEDHGVHKSFASGRASLTRVDVRHVGDRCASGPVANLHIPNSSDMSPESAGQQAASEFLDLFHRPRRDLKFSRQGMLLRKTSAQVPAPFGQHRPGRVATRHAIELQNSQLS